MIMIVLLNILILVSSLIYFVIQKSKKALRDKIRKTLPDFNLPITSDILDNHFKIQIAGAKVFVEGTLGTTKSGFMGYKTFKINGVNENFDVKLGFGFDLFKFWQELKKFEEQVKASGATIDYTFSVQSRLKELEKDVEQMDNLKLMEERSEK